MRAHHSSTTTSSSKRWNHRTKLQEATVFLDQPFFRFGSRQLSPTLYIRLRCTISTRSPHLAVIAGAALPVEVHHAGLLVVAADLGRPSFQAAAGILEATLVLQTRRVHTFIHTYSNMGRTHRHHGCCTSNPAGKLVLVHTRGLVSRMHAALEAPAPGTTCVTFACTSPRPTHNKEFRL